MGWGITLIEGFFSPNSFLDILEINLSAIQTFKSSTIIVAHFNIFLKCLQALNRKDFTNLNRGKSTLINYFASIKKSVKLKTLGAFFSPNKPCFKPKMQAGQVVIT